MQTIVGQNTINAIVKIISGLIWLITEKEVAFDSQFVSTLNNTVVKFAVEVLDF